MDFIGIALNFATVCAALVIMALCFFVVVCIIRAIMSSLINIGKSGGGRRDANKANNDNYPPRP